jgi:putative PIN family toxin of toxin-antitoxin system
MRVTPDTNTVVSGSLWEGNPRRILTAARDGLIELFTSQQLLDELEVVLTRSKFQAKLMAARQSAQAVVGSYAFVATIVEANEIEPVILRDPDDDAVLACALASESEIIVSGDNDLLDLGAYKNIRILSATEFLSEFNL